ncbi:MAG TPA: hypothetical protein VMX97_06905, partial [Hyphomicrobiaceae bacterium]|nr:hypothetical protein [Hyphomicrobiaceae bacterium]
AIKSAGRPLTAFCACELRSPGQFTDAGFKAFNQLYCETLSDWGIYDAPKNPVARSNVCPEQNGPSEPSFHAFSFTVEAERGPASFVISGSGEAKEGDGPYSERIVRLGEQSPDAMAAKARHVLDEMERRLARFGHTWQHTTAAQTYTVYDIHPFMAAEIVKRGAAAGGLTWHFARPPVQGLDYEMDCRAVYDERVI